MGSHPAFYKFITTLNNLILANDIDIEKMENGVSVRRNRKDRGADKDTRKLENRECSPVQFVEGVAHLQKSKCLPLNDLTMIQNRTTALMMKNR
jgi:hypothetical protein